MQQTNLKNFKKIIKIYAILQTDFCSSFIKNTLEQSHKSSKLTTFFHSIQKRWWNSWSSSPWSIVSKKGACFHGRRKKKGSSSLFRQRFKSLYHARCRASFFTHSPVVFFWTRKKGYRLDGRFFARRDVRFFLSGKLNRSGFQCFL